MFVYDTNLNVEPLTDTEKKWLKKLERVLLECPSERIAFLVIGDPFLTVIDNEYGKYLDPHDGKAESQGFALGQVNSVAPFIATTG